jgi:TPP-dependent indolepyruvate ferredoxin oxidoreductase alpha subunit
MHEGICEALLANGVQLLYVTNRTVEQTAKKIPAGHSSFHCEASINEKIVFESALAGSLASKKTACLLSSEGLYEALDSLIVSAYTGVACGFLVIAVQENDEEVTPVGFFSKLPLLVTESADEFQRAVEYGYYISGKYEIPVIIQAVPFEDWDQGSGIRRGQGSDRKAEFIKTSACWAATPKLGYQLHQELHDKIEKIRDEFEDYEGNRKIIKDTTGIITDRLSHLEFYDEDASVLKISTVHPLPDKLVMDFIGDMKEVFMAETYPVIEFQIPQRSKVKKGLTGMMHRGPKPEETIYGFHVVRDKLGHASSINMAHGIKKCMPEKKVLAITYEDHFFRSGMPAFVNTLCNDVSYVLLVMSHDREEEIKNILHGFGFHNCFHLNAISEIERFQDAKELTVLFCRGIG